MSTNQLQKARPCGRLETYSTARHHLGFYNNVGSTGIYTTSTMNSPLETLVFAALHRVIAEHPNLSTVPVDEDKSYPDVHFARLHEIDLRTCVEFHTRETPIPQCDEADIELDKLLRTQHCRNFTVPVSSRPVWRLIINSSPKTPNMFAASWFFHHALSDGSSSMLFHQSFLDGMNASVDPDSISPIVKAPTASLVQSLEELHPMTISWTFFLRAIAGSLLPTYFAPRSPSLWTGSRVNAAADKSLSAHTTTVFLSAETTKAFAIKCRSENTTVTATLCALLAAALHTSIAPGRDLKIDIPISLRPYLSIPETQVVNAITNLTMPFPANADTATTSNALDHFSWATAREVKNELVREVHKKGADNPIALLKYVSDMPKYFTEMLGAERASSAEVSNLGLWRAPTSPANSASPAVDAIAEATPRAPREANWSLGRMVFSQSVNRTGPPISCSAVTGGDGCLALSLNWEEQGAEYEAGLQSIPSAVKEGIERLVR